MCFLLIYFQFLKYLVAPTIFISSCFKMLLLVALKLRNKYILPSCWGIYSFQPFIGFCFEDLYWERYSYCFIRICCCFTVRNHGVLLDHMETPQWGPHGDNFTLVPMTAFDLWVVTTSKDLFMTLRFNKAKLKKKQIPNGILQKNCFLKCRKIKENTVAMKFFITN